MKASRRLFAFRPTAPIEFTDNQCLLYRSSQSLSYTDHSYLFSNLIALWSFSVLFHFGEKLSLTTVIPYLISLSSVHDLCKGRRDLRGDVHRVYLLSCGKRVQIYDCKRWRQPLQVDICNLKADYEHWKVREGKDVLVAVEAGEKGPFFLSKKVDFVQKEVLERVLNGEEIVTGSEPR